MAVNEAEAEPVIRVANPAKSSSREHRPNIDRNRDIKVHILVSGPEGRWAVVLTLTFDPFFHSHLPSNLRARLTHLQVSCDLQAPS